MREIKFDIIFWDGENPVTIQHISLVEALKDDYIQIKDNKLVPTDKCTIIRQFTGLKDKNGTEIYEGDIVEYANLGSYVDIKDNEIDLETGIVVFENGTFCFKDKRLWNDGLHSWHSIENAYEIKIIGNIHENPELLKQE